MTTAARAPRRLIIVAGVALAVGLVLPASQARATAPTGFTLGVGGDPHPSSQPFSGGPITGSADASGSVAPPSCTAPACESFPVTLAAPIGVTQIDLTVTVTFNAPGTNPAGLTGLDVWIVDSGGSTVASATTGSSPAVATGSKLAPATYTVEVTGEAAAANEPYTGVASAAISSAGGGGGGPSVPSVTQSPTPLAFGPAAVVSPVILGAEPQISMERPVASPKANAGLNPARGFVDWPVSSRSNIGTLWRTQNAGDSYRQIVDPTCAERQVPNCYTGGGGDTVNRVNNYDGTVNFGDQESLAQEAYASSVDHGDSFPITRQTPVSSTFTGVDRQWISTVDAPGIMTGTGPAAYELQAVYSYHLPLAGEIVAGVGTDGIVRPGVPVFTGVSQSGPSRIDTQPGSHGSGWFYQGWRDGSHFKVSVAPLSQVQSPTAYTVQTISDSLVPQVFPWINLDIHGNLYAVWVEPDGQLYYSFSRINDPKNDPTATPAGIPGTTWAPKLKVNAPAVGSTVFPEVVAGDPGHIAITYDGTTEYTGLSDHAAGAHWNTYVSASSDAMDSNPVFQSGIVSHQVIHVGSICTSGTTCILPSAGPGDRSLLDMTDITMDSDGRPAVVFTDNNNSFAREEASMGSQGSPFVKVARLSTGPSLLNGHGPYAISYPTDYRPSAMHDATWPNRATGQNLPALDIVGSGVSTDGTLLTARIDLADASKAGFVRDLAAYNTQDTAVFSTDPPATRLQYVARWDFNGETYYLAADVDGTGTPTYYGGKLAAANQLSNGNSAVGVAYRAQPGITVTGQIQGNSMLITGHLSDFGASAGSTLVSYAAHSFAGPGDTAIAGQPDGTPTSQIFTTVRNIDSSPAMDAVLTTPQANVPESPWAGLLLLTSAASVVAVGVRRRRGRRGDADAVGGAS